MTEYTVPSKTLIKRRLYIDCSVSSIDVYNHANEMQLHRPK